MVSRDSTMILCMDLSHTFLFVTNIILFGYIQRIYFITLKEEPITLISACKHKNCDFLILVTIKY
uniref:Uncharacterized protein n=1 Tax=Octopus bimaculoides TaxID=37653 RepID=A0A0L8FX96_OCTBM